MHRFRAQTTWEGTTGVGYADYSRRHHSVCPPAGATLALSADPIFRGELALLNPEQLVVAAASSCQLLSFLAVAAKARLDVVSYLDDAEGVMPDDGKPMRIERIVLRPRVTFAGAVPANFERLVELAHKECFIANSLNAEVAVEATALTALS